MVHRFDPFLLATFQAPGKQHPDVVRNKVIWKCSVVMRRTAVRCIMFKTS